MQDQIMEEETVIEDKQTDFEMSAATQYSQKLSPRSPTACDQFKVRVQNLLAAEKNIPLVPENDTFKLFSQKIHQLKQ